MNTMLLEVKSLRKCYAAGQALFFRKNLGWIKAVDGIDFAIGRRETFSIVGESGCGKTTTAKMILLLEKPTAGRILFRAQDINQQSGSSLREYRKSVQAVFQDPWSSLDPRMKVESIIAEPMEISGSRSRSDVQQRVEKLLLEVGLQPRQARLYPHEFSGGERQRIAVARALALEPALIVLDEPVSALDVSIRAQIMNLLKDIQGQKELSYLLIAHNLATVRYLSDKVAVMYLGKIVELSESEALFCDPLHPYTQALLRAALPGHPRSRKDVARLPGEAPSPLSLPAGCAFNTRCPAAMPVCSEAEPPLQQIGAGRWTACHRYPGHTVEESSGTSRSGGAVDRASGE
jgi:oligopeptide/dipeptide ABC transporter ATP-binding protein